MSRAVPLLLLSVFSLLQEESDLERDFLKLLGETEKVGLAFPDLAEAVARLDAMARGPGGDGLPGPAIDRHVLLRARSAVYAGLVAYLEKSRGSEIEFPLTPGRKVSVRVIRLDKSAVVVRPSAGEMEVRFQDLDVDWVVGSVRSDVLKGQDQPAIHLALVLAQAGRWDAAFRELGGRDHPHPLIAATRRRAFDAVYSKAEENRTAKRFEEALESLAVVAALAPGEARLKELREAIFKDIVAHGRSQALRQKEKEMEATIALLEKHFPDAKDSVKAIRDAAKWYDLTDPNLFGLSGKPGTPIALNEKNGPVQTVDLARMPAMCDAFSVRLRFPKDSKGQGGVLWEGRAWTAWIVPAKKTLFVAQWNKARNEFVHVAEKALAAADSWTLSVFLKEGQYVVSCDDVVVTRVPTVEVSHGRLSLNAEEGKVWFDSIWVRKKD